jgi:hypothetical protein
MAISGTFDAGEEVTFNNVKIAVDQLGTGLTFNTMTTWATNLTITGGDTPTTDFKTYTTPVVFTGERNVWQVEVECVYTEDTTGPFIEIYDDYVAAPGVAYNLRWSPSGGASGSVQYTTTGGKLIGVSIPTQSANDSGAVVFTFTIRAAGITRDTAT